ncbi:thrombomodulin-like [Paralichthys olivaceus]|uniref:thrombomodulin-like n=1 Tax=Paralichthys olivaceus TaxID=8255 RepID=UPI0037535F10
MSPRKQSLLICVVFLCGLEDAVLAQHRHCADDRCVELLSKPEDFVGAQSSCRDSEGTLLTISSEQAVETLTGPLSGRSGSYWLQLHRTDRRVEESHLVNCSSVSVSGGGDITVSWKQCGDELDGFLCQYVLQESCGRLEAHGGAQVRYTTHHMGFDVIDSEVFPSGTIAVVEKVGEHYLDSKHLCYKEWRSAPWNCEVLQGGCEYGCNSTTHTCTCPQGQILQPNSITCAKDPCADCAEDCRWSGVSYECACANNGYMLAQDGKRCVDVDECEEDDDLCTGEGEECFNTEGGYQCRCTEGFEEEDGACVDVEICLKCEHMLCVKTTGVYGCACREGFRVSAEDPTKCERHCGERDCPAVCHQNTDKRKPDMVQCECPKGYIKDMRNNETICTDIDECEMSSYCDQKCENTFGGYRCSCQDGFRLQDDKCVAETEEEKGEKGEKGEDGSGATAQPAVVPSYIKTGSVLGITVFMALGATLLCLLVRTVVKRCGRFELSSFRHPDIDVFYLQQVTTETYKRLSFDKQIKSDLQRL